ncbi:sialate O-acetylesterase [Portibacter lacus]|uniref:9-O-acetylesterase n=1 Tax=Portibacter lacus TaxID=1099794 RepID=A0AA37WDN5_9BACT|nr:sialate O-acetylesterase [Portibacter lacus]GLR15794.1 9-O-acetylesterase [Portibacter lacus]
MKNTLFIILLFFVISSSLNGQFRTKKTIGDHAILQRNVEIPIKGWGAPGESVKVIFNKKEIQGKADLDGRWVVNLPPTPAGGPYVIEIKTANNGLTYNDIYFGDVWLCSGQSNMEWVLKNTDNAEAEINDANDGLIRHFKIPHANSETPEEMIPGGEWVVNSPETAGDFTAVGYYFAKELRASQNIPIGLLNSSWGGSRIQPWISEEMLIEHHTQESYSTYRKKNNMNESTKDKIKKMFPDLTDKDNSVVNGKPIWGGENIDLSKWKTIKTNIRWEDQGFENVDGVAWYRTEFEASGETVLKLGALDDNDKTWVNGVLVGETKGYNVERVYTVPADVIKKGKNILMVRVEDNTGGGGFYTTEFDTRIGNKPLSDFDWKIRFAAIKVTQLSNSTPTLIYNAMISPIIDFPVKGVIWYQGESNAGSIQTAYDYRFLLRTLISDWREKWNQPDLPFFYVSLANWKQPMEEPGNDGWGVIRESMTDVLKVENTGQAIITDIGNPDDIHPRNKKDVGHRLALPARNKVYGENVVEGSPMYGSHKVVGNHVVVQFKTVGEGLMVKNRYGYVQGFSIAGADGKFVWAQAKLQDGKVTVWSEDIAKPVAVRYAWEINPADANLFSKAGYPVTPFRTDNFELK